MAVSSPLSPPGEQAHTLSELLMATALIGLLTALMAPLLTQGSEMRKLRSESMKLQAFLDNVMNQAISRQVAIEVAVSSENARARIVSGEQAGMLLTEYPVAPPVKLSSTTEPVFFYPSSASPTTITLASGRSRCELAMSLRGRVRVSCE